MIGGIGKLEIVILVIVLVIFGAGSCRKWKCLGKGIKNFNRP